jgi:hypothetical protein
MKRSIQILSVIIALIFIISCGGGENTRDTDTKGKGQKLRGTEEGCATVWFGDVALARDRALNDAKNKLVEKLLGSTISGESIVENYRLVKNIIKAKSYGLVKDIDIIEQGLDESEKAYCVTIRGTVEPAVVEDAIADALERYGNPKFMVLINEVVEGQVRRPGFTTAESTIIEYLRDLELDFVDIDMTRNLMKRERTKMNKALTGQVGQDVQDLLLAGPGAEVLIIGKVKTSHNPMLKGEGYENWKSRSATVKLKAIDVYTGRILYQMERDAPAAHINPVVAAQNAIKFAVKKIIGKPLRDGRFKTGKFLNTIIHEFTKAATRRPISALVTGLSMTDLNKFKNQLEHRIRGVAAIKQEGRVGKAAKLVIFFAGQTHEFTQELKAKSDKLGYEINMPEEFPNRVILHVKRIR